jgi:hypothetical protein
MSRGKAKFTEVDIKRVLSAASKAGVSVRVSIEPDGKIVVVTDKPNDGQNVTQKPSETANDLDNWINKHDASATEGH